MIRAAEPRIRTCYLKPGEIHLAIAPSLVTTVLGSCLSVTMHHRATGMSVICHAVMPSIERDRNGKKEAAFQYVDSSLEWMIEQYTTKGIRMSDIEVKMFGGAAIFKRNRLTRKGHEHQEEMSKQPLTPQEAQDFPEGLERGAEIRA